MDLLRAGIFENRHVGVVITDESGTIVDINSSFLKTTGYSMDEVSGKSISLFKSGKHDKIFYDDLWTSIRVNGHWIGEVWNRDKKGEIFAKLLSITKIKHEDRTYFSAFYSDTSIIREHITDIINYNGLTKLPNRSLFRELLEKMLENAIRSDSMLAVLFINMDRFKIINDSIGHNAGDILLIEVAKRLKALIRKSDILSHVGGDEFAIIMTNIRNKNIIAQIAQRVIANLSEPFMVKGRSFFTTGSMGISVYPEDGESEDLLLKNADTALNHAKSLGKNNFQFYSKEMNIAAMERLNIESFLRKSIDSNRDFTSVYQPQIDLKRKTIVGAESLLRWKMDGNIVMPSKFIPIAEETNLIIPMSELIIKDACRRLSIWKSSFPIRIAVNISGRHFYHGDLVKTVEESILEFGTDPEKLEIEITERVLMHNAEKSIEIINHIKNLGCKISIDDFGTGYSSLSYLKQFPVDTLKIDMAFVKDIGKNHANDSIVKTIIDLAHNLGLSVIAEGVETKKQLDFLVEKECDEVQGALFSRAVPPGDFEKFYRKNRTIPNSFDS